MSLLSERDRDDLHNLMERWITMPEAPHAKDCPISGYSGPTACCDGKCLHRMNCCCEGGETANEAYIRAKIASLDAERKYLEQQLCDKMAKAFDKKQKEFMAARFFGPDKP